MKFGRDRTVSIGDAFTCVTRPRVVYTVTAYLNAPAGTPAHVRLVSDARSGAEEMLMSVSALLDTQFFDRVTPS